MCYGYRKSQIKSEWIYKSINFQKMKRKIWRISALRVFIVHRAEILQIFWFIFWKIDDFINPFWLNLTFRAIKLIIICFCSWNSFWKNHPNVLNVNLGTVSLCSSKYFDVHTLLMEVVFLDRNLINGMFPNNICTYTVYVQFCWLIVFCSGLKTYIVNA